MKSKKPELIEWGYFLEKAFFCGSFQLVGELEDVFFSFSRFEFNWGDEFVMYLEK
jgi:hypothetical protein